MRLSKIISDDAWCIARHLPPVLHSFLSAATSSLQVNSSQQEELYMLASLPRWFSFSKYLGTQFALGSRRSKEAKRLRPKWSIFAWKHLHEETPISSWAQSVGVSLAASCFVCLNDCIPVACSSNVVLIPARGEDSLLLLAALNLPISQLQPSDSLFGKELRRKS